MPRFCSARSDLKQVRLSYDGAVAIQSRSPLPKTISGDDVLFDNRYRGMCARFWEERRPSSHEVVFSVVLLEKEGLEEEEGRRAHSVELWNF